MTKYESKILEFLKPLDSAERNDVLTHFNDKQFHDRASGQCSLIRHEDRLDCLIASGYIESDDTTLRITPNGIHKLDEYLENKTRLDKAETNARNAFIVSCVSTAIAAVSAITAVLALIS